MSEQELKPCPFCGQKLEETIGSNGNYYEHYCSFVDYFGTLDSEGKVKWNTRPLEDALTAENEALKAKTAGLEADNARMREALSKISNGDTSEDIYEYIATTPRMLTRCIEIATKALKGGE